MCVCILFGGFSAADTETPVASVLLSCEERRKSFCLYSKSLSCLMSKRFQKTQTRISIATCLTRNQRWFSALKKIKLHAGITLMKGEPTLSSGMWKQTKVEKGPHLPPPYVVNHHLSGQRFKKHAMKSNAENVRSC